MTEACIQYRTGALDWETLRDEVFQASFTLGAFGERDISKLLAWAEYQLELLQFTMNGDALFDETLKVVSRIERELPKQS